MVLLFQWFADTIHIIPFPHSLLIEPGVALRVQLAPNTYRVYSTGSDPTSGADQNQLKCAQIAIDAGVLDFIKATGAIDHRSLNMGGQTMWPSVQDFIKKTIPRPFPEPEFLECETKAEAEIKSWFNRILQNANKSRTVPLTLKHSFHYLQQKQCHGCVLRIEDPLKDPKEAKSYLVEPGFSKKNTAKLAVCLRAMSEGVGSFLRGYVPAITKAATISLPVKAPENPSENQGASLEMKRYANETFYPQLLAACQAIGPQVVPLFFYQNNKTNKKIGCTLKLMIPPPSETPLAPTVHLDKNNTVSRKYNVPMQYSSEDEARIAVLRLAEKMGALQFVKDRGAPPMGKTIPPKPNKATQSQATHSLLRPETKSQAKPTKVQPMRVPKDRDKDTNQPNVALAYGDVEPGEIVPPVAGSSTSSKSSRPSHPTAALPRRPYQYPDQLYVPHPFNPSTPVPYGTPTSAHPAPMPGLGMYGMGTGGSPFTYPSGSAYPSHQNTFPFTPQPPIQPPLPPSNSNRFAPHPTPLGGHGAKRKRGSDDAQEKKSGGSSGRGGSDNKRPRK
ncbi:hypothetical protein BT96DRAFT_939228 [Gymnopus androsaceus JB14]|uniref:Uncharacterized protein n=1 Tax=Gymnopus androsaceus JB14 TaxID=1447944 RepID=A0A6A4HMJ3_9AGAR|nr:hypothetical protein BT96DRAFT_939228 [Gymnopus androsaceus JB14]